MTTPAFVPQDSSSLTEVRYYTQFDPYHYSVDNRPLQDLSANITTISEGGGDSARRAVLLTQLAVSELFRNQSEREFANGSGLITGLPISTPGANTVRLGPGAFYSKDMINTNLTTTVYKQAISLQNNDFSVPPPTVTGYSINYLLQVQHSSITAATIPTSTLPFLDVSNTFLPSVLLNGELKFSLKAGASALTGNQATPTADAGWTPFLVFTSTYGQSTPTIACQGTLTGHRLNQLVRYDYPQTGAATKTDVAGTSVATMADSAVSSISLSIPMMSGVTCPYSPVKVTLVYSTSIANGNVALQTNYLAIGDGTSTATAVTSLTEEVIAAPTTANTVKKATLTMTIPNTAFAGFTSGNWDITAYKLFVTLTRNGSSASDTATGSLLIHDVIVSQ